VSPGHAKKTKLRLKNLGEKFGDRWIHSISAAELEQWLQQFPNPKTCNHYRASAVSLFLYAQNVLQAIPESGKVAPQRIQPANTDKQTKVEIYTPQEMEAILGACIEHDIMLIPPIVLGCFDGLRPNEVHGEDARYEPLAWGNFGWARKELHITGQKVRGLAVRDLQIPENAFLWLEPFSKLTGPVWPWRSCYNERVKRLVEGKAKLRVVYDGFRHSYASYRVRQLGGSLDKLAEEMGNSPREIINSYKRNVRDEDAAAWFTLRPPVGYAELVRAALPKTC
jgi:integrase